MNKFFRFCLLILLIAESSANVQAQQDPVFSQYLFNPMLYNPAYAGIYDMGSATVQSRIQKFSPSSLTLTSVFSASSSLPTAQGMGIGINVINDRIGVGGGHTAYNNTEIDLAYSYKIQLAEQTYLAMGLQADIMSHKIDNSGLNPKDVADPTIQQPTINATKLNFGTGLYLINEERYFLSASAPRILNTTFENNGVIGQRYSRQFYFSGGAILNAEGNIPIRPAFMLKTIQGQSASLDLSTSFLLSDIIWTGVSVRNFHTLAIIGQLDISEFVRVGYSTDLPLSNVAFKNLGTHEVSLNINFTAFKKQVVVVPRYF
ncbi:MAG TPA: PorP/SprF family type IX secretion system membrane protein [Cytophagaceae bacterium]|jgi:type IX secretion system PorP/SprF family membrane protein|nr:PorP/SprF family type IX secretion system membrane protein [Cytophagaceae bacterium]